MRSPRFWLASGFVLLAAFLVVLHNPRRALFAQQATDEFATASAAPVPDVDPKAMDQTCKPCQDLFKYADGDWVKNNPIPADYPSWGRFSELAERNREHLREILEAAATDTTAAAGSNERFAVSAAPRAPPR